MDEDDSGHYLQKIKNVDQSLFKNPNDLILYFNDLIRYYACAVQKRPVLLIGIDEVAKIYGNETQYYFENLGKLFVKLRNSLNYVLFVFISTDEDWAKYDLEIKNSFALEGQINEFLFKMPLRQLDVAEMIDVFKKRMETFWSKNPTERNALYAYYPFSEKLFDYVYRYNRRDLRRSIKFLDKLWSYFRTKKEVPRLNTSFNAM